MKMKAMLISLLFIIICIPAQGFVIKGKILKKNFKSTVTNEMRDYHLYLPAKTKKKEKIPILLFLHGNGERGDTVGHVQINGPLHEIRNGRNFPFIVIAPQMPDYPNDYIYSPNVDTTLNWSERFPMVRESFDMEYRYDEPYPPYGWDKIEKDLIYLINETVKKYNGDTNRIYITGFSYGGYGTWYMLSKYPELFAAGIPVCGAGNPEDVKTIGKTPVWLFHGGRDRVILPQWSLKMAEELDKAGGNVIVTIHEDLGHDCWRRVYSGQDVYDWLLKNTKR